jgi:hypothetical protein
MCYTNDKINAYSNTNASQTINSIPRAIKYDENTFFSVGIEPKTPKEDGKHQTTILQCYLDIIDFTLYI